MLGYDTNTYETSIIFPSYTDASVSMGNDDEALVSDMNNNLHYVTYNSGANTIQINLSMTVTGIRKVRMIRGQTYSIIQ